MMAMVGAEAVVVVVAVVAVSKRKKDLVLTAT